MRDVTLVILNSLRIKCHIRRPLNPGHNGKSTSITNTNYQSNCGVGSQFNFGTVHSTLN